MNISVAELKEVRKMIDEAFGRGGTLGYAYNHPELVSAVLVANALHDLDYTLGKGAHISITKMN